MNAWKASGNSLQAIAVNDGQSRNVVLMVYCFIRSLTGLDFKGNQNLIVSVFGDDTNSEHIGISINCGNGR